MKRFWFVKFILFGALAFLVFTFATMYLWNSLIPSIFHGPTIVFWQAFGLLVLGRLLFGGFGRGHCGGRWRRHGHWRRHWQDKMESMTPEQREELRKKWRARCGGGYDEEQAKEQ
jgi:hypothetical protein